VTDPAGHAYISTACFHGLCRTGAGNCRNTCKFCDAPCRHECHDGDTQAPPWVNQAREMAVRLLAAARAGTVPPALAEQIGRQSRRHAPGVRVIRAGA